MNHHPSHAPLVATSLDDAAELMVSEGSPVHSSAPPASRSEAECCGSLMESIRSTVDCHPLVVLMVSFAVGVAAGFGTASVWEEH